MGGGGLFERGCIFKKNIPGNSGIINPSCDGLSHNTKINLAHCPFFILIPSGLEKIQSNS